MHFFKIWAPISTSFIICGISGTWGYICAVLCQTSSFSVLIDGPGRAVGRVCFCLYNLWTKWSLIFVQSSRSLGIDVVKVVFAASIESFLALYLLLIVLRSRRTAFCTVPYRGWLGSRAVSVLDSGAEGPGFKSHSRRCRVTVLGKLFTPIVPLFTKQQNW